MGRMKDAEKIPALERHKTPVVTTVRSDSVRGHAAGLDGKRGVSQLVRPLDATREERREAKYVAKALKAVPHGTSVFNWPCGCGRLLPLLKKLDYRVTSADSSSEAVGRIRLYGGLLGEDCVGDKDDFQVVNIFQTGFANDHFGAAIVNQLCCLPEPQIRELILKELRRICSGLIVVSFFCNTMIYETARCKRREHPEPGAQHYLRLSHRAFAREVRRCGLVVKKWMPRYRLASGKACAVLARKTSAVSL